MKFTDLFVRRPVLAIVVNLIELVCSAGVPAIYTQVLALHESIGMRRVGVYERVGWKFGAWHDVGWWQARLAPAFALRRCGCHCRKGTSARHRPG